MTQRPGPWLRPLSFLMGAVILTGCAMSAPRFHQVLRVNTVAGMVLSGHTDELIDIPALALYNTAASPVRIQRIELASASSALRLSSTIAYYLDSGYFLVGFGDLVKECGYRAEPVSSIVVKPDNASSWIPVMTIVVSKPGRYSLRRVKIFYKIDGVQEWQYQNLNAELIVKLPPEQGPYPKQQQGQCLPSDG
jgi:hypothetical protein